MEDSPLEKFIYQRCKNATDDTISSNILTRLRDLDSFVDRLNNPERICPPVIYNQVEVVRKLTVDMEVCFPGANETYLPQFIYEGFVQMVEFLCGNRTLEIFFSEQGRDCRDSLQFFSGGEELRNCTEDFFWAFENDMALTSEILCFDLKTAEDCIDKAINTACPYFFAFRLMNHRFFKAVSFSCNSAVANSSGVYFFLIISILTNIVK